MEKMKRFFCFLLAAGMLCSLLPAPAYATFGEDVCNGQHTWSSWEPSAAAAPPTCTEGGMEVRYCTMCGISESRQVSALGHDWGEWATRGTATCTEGATQHRWCSRCGQNESRDVPALGHSAGDWQVVQSATCTAEGIEQRKCTRCGTVVESRAIPVTSHAWDGGKVTQNATCTAAGVKTFTCTRCGGSYTESISALGHSAGDWQVVQSATCTAEGSEQRKCTRCGAVVESRAIPVTSHAWDGGKVTQNAACTAAGVKTFTCTRCGGSYTESISALGHSAGDWQVVQSASCTAEGTEQRKCTRCGAVVESRAIPALGHTTMGWQTVKSPSCTEIGVEQRICTRCGEMLESLPIPALGHDYSSQVTKEATCTDEGVTTFTCTHCDGSYTEPIPALGHDYSSQVTQEATCTDEGVTTFTCTHCGGSYTEPIPALGHDYSSQVTKEATYTDDGVTTFTCTHCGDSYTEPIIRVRMPLPDGWDTVDDMLTISRANGGDENAVYSIGGEWNYGYRVTNYREDELHDVEVTATIIANETEYPLESITFPEVGAASYKELIGETTVDLRPTAAESRGNDAGEWYGDDSFFVRVNARGVTEDGEYIYAKPYLDVIRVDLGESAFESLELMAQIVDPKDEYAEGDMIQVDLSILNGLDEDLESVNIHAALVKDDAQIYVGDFDGGHTNKGETWTRRVTVAAVGTGESVLHFAGTGDTEGGTPFLCEAEPIPIKIVPAEMQEANSAPAGAVPGGLKTVVSPETISQSSLGSDIKSSAAPRWLRVVDQSKKESDYYDGADVKVGMALTIDGYDDYELVGIETAPGDYIDACSWTGGDKQCRKVDYKYMYFTEYLITRADVNDFMAHRPEYTKANRFEDFVCKIYL